METFCAVGDPQLCEAISAARARVVYAAAGISGRVARALGAVLGTRKDIDVTVVIDPDEEVCRIGYGDQEGLEILQGLADRHHFGIRKQEGLRIGVLLVDDEVLLWAPTPQSVEAAPTAPEQPNGLRLGRDPMMSLEKAIAPEGTDTVPSAGEIGKTAVTPAEVKETLKALEANPVIPVALAQVTRVFSSKLQFVELKVENAKVSKAGLTIPTDKLNADMSDQLRNIIDGRLRAFMDLRTLRVEVPAFTTAGVASHGANGKQLTEPMSEADLDARRRDIERQYLYGIAGHGTLIARDQKRSFEACLSAFTLQLTAHADGLRKNIQTRASDIKAEAIEILGNRARHAPDGPKSLDTVGLGKLLDAAVERVVSGKPKVTHRYKDVTFEHTQNDEFRTLVRKALPAEVQKRLGSWDVHFQAAKEQKPDGNPTTT